MQGRLRGAAAVSSPPESMHIQHVFDEPSGERAKQWLVADLQEVLPPWRRTARRTKWTWTTPIPTKVKSHSTTTELVQLGRACLHDKTKKNTLFRLASPVHWM